IDGGPGGYDSLVVDNPTPTATRYTPSGPHSGTIALGARTIRFAGLEPVTLNGPQTTVTVTGSSGNDVMNVQDLGGSPDMIEVSSPTSSFESMTFQVPTTSLTVDGNGGFDQINVVNPINLGSANFIAQNAAQITVPSAASITTTGSVTLTARSTGPQSSSPSALLSALGLTSATSLLHFDPSVFSPSTLLNDVNLLSFLGSFANVNVQGNITAGSPTTPGNISISA